MSEWSANGTGDLITEKTEMLPWPRRCGFQKLSPNFSTSSTTWATCRSSGAPRTWSPPSTPGLQRVENTPWLGLPWPCCTLHSRTGRTRRCLSWSPAAVAPLTSIISPHLSCKSSHESVKPMIVGPWHPHRSGGRRGPRNPLCFANHVLQNSNEGRFRSQWEEGKSSCTWRSCCRRRGSTSGVLAPPKGWPSGQVDRPWCFQGCLSW